MAPPRTSDNPGNADRRWLYSPQSVVVIGASRDPNKIGSRYIQALIRGGFKGAIYPINTAGGEIVGIPALKSTNELPHGVDIAVLAVPALASVDQFRNLIGRGVRGAIVVASGFGETADGGVLESELAALAAANNIRLVGPNTQGLVDFSSSFVCSYGSGMVERPYGAKVAVISQSGGFTGQLFRLLDERGVACTRIVSTGNESDLGVADFLEDVVDSPDISAVLLYMESIRHGRRLVRVLEGLNGKKPVLIMKSGRTPTGATAALSHTGAIAGNYAVTRDVLQQFGAVLSPSIDELADRAVGAVLLGSRSVLRPGVAILSQSGGAAVELADLLYEAGLSVPEMTRETQQTIQSFVPSYGAVRNPVDMTASVLEKPELVARVLTAAAHDSNIGVVVICLTDATNPDLWRHIREARQAINIPVVLAWLGDRSEAGVSWGHVRAADWPRVISTRAAVSAIQTLYAAAAARQRGLTSDG